MESNNRMEPEYKGKNTDITAAVAAMSKEHRPFHQMMESLRQDWEKQSELHDKYKCNLARLTVYDKPKKPENGTETIAEISFGATGVITVLLLLLHFVIWVLNLVFNIPWDTWRWTYMHFFWGIGLSGLATGIAFVVYKLQMNEYEKNLALYNDYVNRKESLEKSISQQSDILKELGEKMHTLSSVQNSILGCAIRNNLGIPFDHNDIDNEDYDGIKDRYFRLLEMKDSLKDVAPSDLKSAQLRFFNEKLSFFHSISMRYEIKDKGVFNNEFVPQIKASDKSKDISILRERLNVQKSKGEKMMDSLPQYIDLLQDNRIEKSLKEFKKISNRDTSKFLFIKDTDKKAAQTKDMFNILTSVRREYQEFKEICSKMGYILEYVRGCSYRNIYLGVELLNFVRLNSGGSSLRAEHDTVKLESVANLNAEYNAKDLTSKTGEVAEAELDNLLTKAELLNNKSVQKFVVDNPKIAAAYAAFELGGSAIRVVGAYFDAVSKNTEAQKNITDEISQMSDAYIKAQGGMLRAIEITQGIIKANDGFMAIYEPLKRKVFGEVYEAPTKAELVQLAAALNDYKKISESKL